MVYQPSGILTKLDGFENVTNSHSSNATVWKGLNNSASGSVSNGTWGSNYLNFNGTSTKVNLGQMNYDNMTVEATVETNLTNGNAQYYFGNWEAGGGRTRF